MTFGERDISALRELIMGNQNFSDVEKHILVDAITVSILCHEQKEKEKGKGEGDYPSLVCI